MSEVLIPAGVGQAPTHFAMTCWELASPGWRQHPHYAELLSQVVDFTFQYLRNADRWPCWLCGEPYPEMVPRKLRLNEGFTNHGWAKAPRSGWLCLPCCVFLMSHPEARHYWRNQGHVFTASEPYLRHPVRAEWRDVLLEPPGPPFLLCLPTSGHKHLIFRAEIGRQRDRYPLQLEEETVVVERSVLAVIVCAVEELLAAGVRRDELRTGLVNTRRILDLGLERYRALMGTINGTRTVRPQHLELALRIAHTPERSRDAGLRD